MAAPFWHANCLMSHTDYCTANRRTSEGIHVKAEQRQHPRYGIRDIDFNVFSHGTQISGRLVNISRGGLAFQFVSGPMKATECRSIDILGSGPDRFYISKIACRRIYDIGFLAEGGKFTGVETSLRGVQFIDLTEEQFRKLTELIDCYGVID